METNEVLCKFVTDYKRFKKGQYIAVPTMIMTGQWKMMQFRDEAQRLLEEGILVREYGN